MSCMSYCTSVNELPLNHTAQLSMDFLQTILHKCQCVNGLPSNHTAQVSMWQWTSFKPYCTSVNGLPSNHTAQVSMWQWTSFKPYCTRVNRLPSCHTSFVSMTYIYTILHIVSTNFLHTILHMCQWTSWVQYVMDQYLGYLSWSWYKFVSIYLIRAQVILPGNPILPGAVDDVVPSWHWWEVCQICIFTEWMTYMNKAIRDGKYLAPPHTSAWQRSPH